MINYMCKKAAAIPLATAAFVLTLAPEALAVQSHGDPEGYFVHQIAHLVFMAAMVFMIAVLKKPVTERVKGWHSVRWAAIFFLLWNIDTFSAHVAERGMGLGTAYKQGSVIYLRDIPAGVYYYGSLAEYFFLVPAFVFLAVGLYRLKKYLREEESG